MLVQKLLFCLTDNFGIFIDSTKEIGSNFISATGKRFCILIAFDLVFFCFFFLMLGQERGVVGPEFDSTVCVEFTVQRHAISGVRLNGYSKLPIGVSANSLSLPVFVQGVHWTSRPMVAEISSSYPNPDKDKQKNMHGCIPLLFTILDKSVIQVIKFKRSVRGMYSTKKKIQKEKKKSILNNKT